MASAGVAMTEFMNGAKTDTERQRRNQDEDYVRLGHTEEEEDDDLEIEEFELHPPDANYRRKRVLWWVQVSIAVLLVLGAGSAIVYWGLPFMLENVLIPMLVWEASTFSRPVLSLVLVLSLALFPVTIILPSGPSMWLTGMIFGYGIGFLIIMGGSFFGMTFPYFIGRWLLHDRIQDMLKKWPKQAAVLRIAEQGSWFYQFRSIFILRFSPIPYPLFNYAITGTNITYGPYLAGSMLGQVPEAFITIYTGKMLKELADLKKDKMPLTWPKMIYYAVSFIVVIGIGVAVTVLGRRALADLEIREAAEREKDERQLRGVVDEEELIDGRGIKRSLSLLSIQ